MIERRIETERDGWFWSWTVLHDYVEPGIVEGTEIRITMETPGGMFHLTRTSAIRAATRYIRREQRREDSNRVDEFTMAEKEAG